MIDLPKVWLPACELAELPRESGVAFMGPPSHPGSFLSLDSPSVSQEIELFLPNHTPLPNQGGQRSRQTAHLALPPLAGLRVS